MNDAATSASVSALCVGMLQIFSRVRAEFVAQISESAVSPIFNRRTLRRSCAKVLSWHPQIANLRNGRVQLCATRLRLCGAELRVQRSRDFLNRKEQHEIHVWRPSVPHGCCWKDHRLSL